MLLGCHLPALEFLVVNQVCVLYAIWHQLLIVSCQLAEVSLKVHLIRSCWYSSEHVCAVTAAFLNMLCSLRFGIYIFFGIWQFIAIIFVYFLVPETRGVPIEEVTLASALAVPLLHNSSLFTDA